MTGLLPIRSTPGYFAGDDGHIYSTRSRWGSTAPRRLSEKPTHDGYMRVRVVRVAGQPVRSQAVAPLIAEVFRGPRPEGMQVRHLDGVKTNNTPENLAYGTPLDNARDRDAHGTTVCGERSKQSRHTDAQRRAAVARVQAGESQHVVAADLGVWQTTIGRWCQAAANGHRLYQWRAAA